MLNLMSKVGLSSLLSQPYLVPNSSSRPRGTLLNRQNLTAIPGGRTSFRYRDLLPEVASGGFTGWYLAQMRADISSDIPQVVSRSVSTPASATIDPPQSGIMTFNTIDTTSTSNQRRIFTIGKRMFCILKRQSDGAGLIQEIRTFTAGGVPTYFPTEIPAGANISFFNTGTVVTSSSDGSISAAIAIKVNFVYFNPETSHLFVVSERMGGSGQNSRVLVITQHLVTFNGNDVSFGQRLVADNIVTLQGSDKIADWGLCFETTSDNNATLFFAASITRPVPFSPSNPNNPASTIYLRRVIKVDPLLFPADVGVSAFESSPVPNFQSSQYRWPGEIMTYAPDIGNAVIQQTGVIRQFFPRTALDGEILNFAGIDNEIGNFNLMRDSGEFQDQFS